MTARVREQAVLLGSENSLVGILARVITEPADRPAVVILNTGIIHRVGYHRIFVGMSRALAASGCMVLRFDFSGIGDSAPRHEAMPPLASCMADITEVLDWLEKTHQASRVILVGLCSGADHAVLYGHTDARVVGLVLLDPTIPATIRHAINYVRLRLMERRSWARFLTGRSQLIAMGWRKVRRMSRQAPERGPAPVPSIGSRREIEQQYRRSMDRGIRILAVFTGESTRQTYREQMTDAFPRVQFGDRLQLEFFPGSDHVFRLEADRSELNRVILRWVGALSAS
jgi:pimeloyl-ACP methyl ester carboxylesterase